MVKVLLLFLSTCSLVHVLFIAQRTAKLHPPVLRLPVLVEVRLRGGQDETDWWNFEERTLESDKEEGAADM